MGQAAASHGGIEQNPSEVSMAVAHREFELADRFRTSVNDHPCRSIRALFVHRELIEGQRPSRGPAKRYSASASGTHDTIRWQSSLDRGRIESTSHIIRAIGHNGQSHAR